MLSPTGGPIVEDALFDAEELHERAQRLVQESGGVARIRQIGTSEQNRPIELIEIGDGPRSALIVGAPHPNEPIGCVTILTLIELLSQNPERVRALGFRWAFIPCIEPDGLMLNRGWLNRPRTPECYFEHFFRPAFDRQAEYTFPMHLKGWTFDRPTQGNRAWRLALEQMRPDLLVSLHNAEYGGVYYLLSREVAGLAERLAADPQRAGLTLNPVGEIDVGVIRPGVFRFLDLSAAVSNAIAAGASPAAAWPAGESSQAYAYSHFGTLSLINEVPYWDDPRLRDCTGSDYRVHDLTAELEKLRQDNVSLLSRGLKRLIQQAPPATEPLIAALLEAQRFARRSPSILTPSGAHEAAERRLTVAELCMRRNVAELHSLRPCAMLARLAEFTGDVDEAAGARATISDRLAKLRTHATFDIVPLATLVGLQIGAILAAAQTLSDPGCASAREQNDDNIAIATGD